MKNLELEGRKLASIRQISEIRPIEGADAIETAIVDGWAVVTAKTNGYRINDKVIYVEIDSWVPNEIAPFLTKEGKEPSEYNGVKGERLRTVKLRGQVSQGLLLPLDIIKPYLTDEWLPGGYVVMTNGEEIRLWETGTDLTGILGIQKWEAPIPANMSGKVAGAFPSDLIPKTDQERVQNLADEVFEYIGMTFDVTEKLEGTSFTAVRDRHPDGGVRVCSRNLELVETEDNLYWQVARKFGIIEFLENLEGVWGIQGEIVGPGVQKNYYGLKEVDFFVYNIRNVYTGKVLNWEQSKNFLEGSGLKMVPLIGRVMIPSMEKGKLVDWLVNQADGQSILNASKRREGLVWRSPETSKSFKTISNSYLIKNDG